MLPAASTANAKESAPQAGRGWIGVQIQPVTTNIAESLGMKEDKGALIAEPLTDGPAAKAGILSGDVITALNDQPVNDIRDLAKQIGDMAPGDRNGLALEHGFKIGDVILDVGGKKVVTPVDVRNAVRDAHKDGKRVVLMRLKSDETTKFVAVPIARA
jgi:serine protease Do